MKILNLYAGIGGNRKLWGNEHEIIAVEINPEIAKIYQDFFPNDKVVVDDAHQYLLEHFKEFDFIWSSPPCPSHSRMRFLCHEQEGKPDKYPDMKLYEEILFLKYWFKGKWVIENVLSYYSPLIKPYISGKHYFWSNFHITNLNLNSRNIKRVSPHKEHIRQKERLFGFDLNNRLSGQKGQEIMNNCVEPRLGLYIFNCAFNIKQGKFDIDGRLKIED